MCVFTNGFATAEVHDQSTGYSVGVCEGFEVVEGELHILNGCPRRLQ